MTGYVQHDSGHIKTNLYNHTSRPSICGPAVGVVLPPLPAQAEGYETTRDPIETNVDTLRWKSRDRKRATVKRGIVKGEDYELQVEGGGKEEIKGVDIQAEEGGKGVKGQVPELPKGREWVVKEDPWAGKMGASEGAQGRSREAEMPLDPCK